MTRLADGRTIRLRGVRQNNLKGIDLDLPTGKLVVVTGLSGSGKSSLAFDTLYAEGQRRYIETFSPYARQFFDRIDKPLADSIEGIPPAIAVEQRNAVRTTRSTVGTMTEICDYAKLIWHHQAVLHCRQCGKPVAKESPQDIWKRLQDQSELAVAFRLPLSDKMTLKDSLDLVARQGYQRLLIPSAEFHKNCASAGGDETKAVGHEIASVADAASKLQGAASILIVQDRIAQPSRTRLVEACEQAYHFGKGKLEVYSLRRGGPSADWTAVLLRRFSKHLHCAGCDLDYKPASSALFSFNNPLGACPACHGFGRIISIDYNLALPDRSKTLAEGVVKPWQSGVSAECQTDMRQFCRQRGVPMDVPFDKMSRQHQDWVLNGDPHYGEDPEHEWPKAWYGVKGYFKWLESKSYKMHVRVLLSRYRSYTECPDCRGRRFQSETLLYRMAAPKGFCETSQKAADAAQPGLVLSDFYQFPIAKAHELVNGWLAERPGRGNDPLTLAMKEVQARLGYLVEAGLGYLTLDRPTRSLSGGETERVHLTTCLGSRLVNTLFILDEPSVGLHSRDTGRLIAILQKLRDAGNTVVVVEHEASVMRAADEIIDLGPGSGEKGGRIVFHGKYAELLKSKTSLTGRFLSGKGAPPVSARRPVLNETGDNCTPMLRLSHATLHNLKDVTVELPLGRFICVTGVSGSGKSTLIRDILLPALQKRLASMAMEDPDDTGEDKDTDSTDEPGESLDAAAEIEGCEHLAGAVLADQSSLGKTPRSNPILYIGAFDMLREFFARCPQALALEMQARDFSFNARAGQCYKCRGAGYEKIEMQFLSDVHVKCPECNGRRYRPEILAVKVQQPSPSGQAPIREWSVADLLEATVDDAMEFLGAFEESKYVRSAMKSLQLLQKTGLGYLRLGQPINTLSGGECQRLKLVRHIAESGLDSGSSGKGLLFLFDEPTTGLHFEDVRVLTEVFQQLTNDGHTVLVIEHHLDMISAADWVIDMGPEGGDGGGQIVAAGPPEKIAQCPQSHTGAALRAHQPGHYR